jgi:hypothetical protein
VNSFIGAEDADNDGSNFQEVTYATTGAGIVNTSGTTMTFVSGIPPNSSMTGQIAINNVAYTIGSCSASTCTLTTSAGTQSGVRYNYPVDGPQNAGSYGAPQLINYPALWNMPVCSGSSFPYSNQPCLETPLDSHLNSNNNAGNDSGMVFYSSTTYGNTHFPRSMGEVSVTSGSATLLYGGQFAASWVGHNIVVNGGNCTIASYLSPTQITVSGCSLGTLASAPYYFTVYPGGGYDEVEGVVGGGLVPAAGFNYRFAYEYNSTMSFYFNTQNAITACSQTGRYCLVSTDWQCELGTTNGTNTNGCAPDWPVSTVMVSGAQLWPQTGNNGKYVYQSSGSCTTGSSEPNPWNQTVGGTQPDGGCTWTNIGTYRGDVVAVVMP